MAEGVPRLPTLYLLFGSPSTLSDLYEAALIYVTGIFNVICTYVYIILSWGQTAQSLQQLTMSWTVRGLNPSGGEISPPFTTDPVTHPASCIMSTGSFPAIKRPRRGVNHPPHLVKVKVKFSRYRPEQALGDPVG